MSRPTDKIRRPRHRPHRRKSRRFAEFLSEMATKWDGQQATVSVSSVGSNVLGLGSDPAGRGPFALVGAPPPDHRGVARFWLTYAAGNATIYGSLAALARGDAKSLASWPLAPAFVSLTAATMALASSTDINATTNVFAKTAHGFASGDGPFRATTSSALPTGLATVTDYYLIKVDADTFKLTDTLAHALAGTNAIDISDAGTGTQTLTLAGVADAEDALRMVAHGMATGDGPVRAATTGTLPTGLLAGTDYYVIKVDADHVKLATSHANAIAGTAVNITAIGSGSHTLPRALTAKKDLSAEGLVHYLGQGLKPELLKTTDVADVETVFA